MTLLSITQSRQTRVVPYVAGIVKGILNSTDILSIMACIKLYLLSQDCSGRSYSKEIV